jgi:hypothetical protein
MSVPTRYCPALNEVAGPLGVGVGAGGGVGVGAGVGVGVGAGVAGVAATGVGLLGDEPPHPHVKMASKDVATKRFIDEFLRGRREAPPLHAVEGVQGMHFCAVPNWHCVSKG